jgi:hypothetical protein
VVVLFEDSSPGRLVPTQQGWEILNEAGHFTGKIIKGVIFPAIFRCHV